MISCQAIRVAVLGAGSSGLITAKTLLDDGFNVTVFTRDRNAGGVYAQERLYPGLMMNNVHGEFNFSSLAMPLPKNSEKTGGRLSGKDMQTYMEEFADWAVKPCIRYGKEVLNVRRVVDTKGWLVQVKDLTSGVTEESIFDKVVLCTGGCSNPNIPSRLSPRAADTAAFSGPVVHSSDFARERENILFHLKLAKTQDRSGKVVVVGGGKSAMDIATYLSKQDINVTMVFENTDANVAVPTPLPQFFRRSRILAILSPHIELNSRLERFLHTTMIGSFITKHCWSFLHWNSLGTLGVQPTSPLVPAFHMFWSIRTNDLGKPSPEGFHAQIRRGKIGLAAPTRAVGYTRAGGKQYVVLRDGNKLEADAVILCTGFKSSWAPILDDETRQELWLEPYCLDAEDKGEHFESHKSLRAAPVISTPQAYPTLHILVHRGIAPIGNLQRRDFAVNGANFGAGNGMLHEVSAHWISSYFIGDSFLRLPDRDTALSEARREASFVRRRYPETWVWANESYSAGIAFWNWPQLVDSLLNDMGLRNMRSGGSWWNWMFKIIDTKEIVNLREERQALRLALNK